MATSETNWSREEEFNSEDQTLFVMLQKEQTTYSRKNCDYLLGIRQEQQVVSIVEASSPTASTKVNEADRTELVDWCYRVIDLFKFEREVVAIAMDMVDRFLSKFKTCDLAYKVLHDRVQFQLLIVTALYVAIKTNERIVIGSKLFSIISCNLYSISDIEDMELGLLCGLSWYISAPTSAQAANHILKLISSQMIIKKSTWALILDEARYQIEHSVRDYYFVTQRPSTVAMAAIINALDLVEEVHVRQSLCVHLLRVYIGVSSSSSSRGGGGEYFGEVCAAAADYHHDWIDHILASKHRLNLLINECIESPSIEQEGEEVDDDVRIE